MIPTLLAWLFLSFVLPDQAAFESAGWLSIAALLCSPLVLPALCMPPIFGCQTFVSDDFSTNTIANYTQVSGSWSVSGGALTTSSTGGAVIIHNTAGAYGHGRVTATMQASVDGSKIGLVGSYTDASNYVYAEIEVNGISNEVKLYSRSGGVDTLLSNATLSVARNINMTMELCWDGTHAMASVTYGASVSDLVFGAYSGTSNQAGIRFNGTSGSATFADFAYKQHINDEATCAPCGKAFCTTICQTSPANMQVVFSGITKPGGGCADCTAANLTMILPQGATCVWVLNSFGTICNGASDSPERVAASVQMINNGTKVKIEVQMAPFYPGTPIVFYDLNDAGLGAPPGDCTAVNASVPFNHTTGFVGTTCTWSGSSATVTAA